MLKCNYILIKRNQRGIINSPVLENLLFILHNQYNIPKNRLSKIFHISQNTVSNYILKADLSYWREQANHMKDIIDAIINFEPVEVEFTPLFVPIEPKKVEPPEMTPLFVNIEKTPHEMTPLFVKA